MSQYLADTERVITLFNSGMTQVQIAAKIGHSQHYVSKRLLRAGISRSKKDTWSIKMAAAPAFTPDPAIVKMYADGMSSMEIHRAIGRSHGYVLRHVRAAGIIRTNGQSLRIIAKRKPPILRIGSHGYYVFSFEGKDVLLHRAIMSAAIGRRLGSNEHVHHKNHNPFDNRVVNLEITSPSEHTRHHHFLGLTCVICGMEAQSRSLCGKHYQQVRNAGQLRQFPKHSNCGKKLTG